jgi:D-arginine dehydrogenase
MSRVLVIGGGVAGLSVAAALAERGREVVLFEAEPQTGTQSSGRSAGIYRLAVEEPVNVRLALRSRDIAREVAGPDVIRALGGVYPCRDAEQQRAILVASRRAGTRAATAEDLPRGLAPHGRPGVFSEGDGVIDTHALVVGLERKARRHGARLVTGTRVEALSHAGGRVCGVTAGSEAYEGDVVDATGAWSPGLVPKAPGLVAPARRHLFVLDGPTVGAIRTVVWDLGAGLYVRPESGGLLASPCDETAMAGCEHVPTQPEATSVLFDKLARWAPMLSDLRVRRVWAGLRPLTPDHRFVVGPDPSVPGLFRLGGFGGHGMTAGPAAGELAARMLCHEDVPEAQELAPGRFASPA